MKNRAYDWFRQAQNDLLWARDTLAAGRFAQACFICQQVAEKALKAVAYAKDYDLVKTHSVMEIARSLGIGGDIETMAKKLDLYYIGTRYPDAVPSGAPYEYFSQEQAAEAIGFAEKILETAGAYFHD